MKLEMDQEIKLRPITSETDISQILNKDFNYEDEELVKLHELLAKRPLKEIEKIIEKVKDRKNEESLLDNFNFVVKRVDK